MKDYKFEKEIVDKIIHSIKNEPDKWRKSFMGMKREYDGLELSVGIYSIIEIYRPYEYKFKFSITKRRLFRVARKFIDDKEKKKENEKKLNKQQKLLSFLHLNENTRKDKLK